MKSELDKLEREIIAKNKKLERDIKLLKQKSYSGKEHPVKELVKEITKKQTVDYDPLIVQPKKVNINVKPEPKEKESKLSVVKMLGMFKPELDFAFLQKQRIHSKPLVPHGEKRRQLTVLRILLVVLLIFTIVFSIYFVQGVFATTEQNFIALSQNCLYSDYNQNVQGSVVSNKARGCTITREITKVAENEPVEVKYLLEGKKMVCHYDKGEFDKNKLDYMTQDLQNCEGELKDILVELAS